MAFLPIDLAGSEERCLLESILYSKCSPFADRSSRGIVYSQGYDELCPTSIYLPRLHARGSKLGFQLSGFPHTMLLIQRFPTMMRRKQPLFQSLEHVAAYGLDISEYTVCTFSDYISIRSGALYHRSEQSCFGAT